MSCSWLRTLIANLKEGVSLFGIDIQGYDIVISLNIFALIMVVLMLVFLTKLKPFKKCSIEIDEAQLGIGESHITLKYNNKDREIAYKLWVELSTRKLGIRYDRENDVIVEVYDSWYTFFGVARELMKDIPMRNVDKTKELVTVCTEVLNKGLRPHLTAWQAKFRRWYDLNIHDDQYKNMTPQEIQKEYPLYNDLLADLERTTELLIELREVMHKIAFGEC